MLAKQEKRALLLLKFKKHKENEAESIDNQLLSVFKMIEDIEWESTNIKVCVLFYMYQLFRLMYQLFSLSFVHTLIFTLLLYNNNIIHIKIFILILYIT